MGKLDYAVTLVEDGEKTVIVRGGRVHPRPGRGGRLRPPLLVPRGRVLVVRGQGRRGHHRSVGPVVPRGLADVGWLRAHVRRVPHERLRDPHPPGGGALLNTLRARPSRSGQGLGAGLEAVWKRAICVPSPPLYGAAPGY